MSAVLDRQESAFPAGDHYRPHVTRSARRIARASYQGLTWTSNYRIRLLFTDTVLVAGVLFASVVVSPAPASSGWVALVLGTLWSIALEGYRTRGSRVVGIGSSEYKRVVRATVLPFASVAIFAVVVDTPGVGELFLIGFPVGTLSLVVSRWLWRHWLITQRGQGHYLSRALVVGPISDVIGVASRMERGSGAAYKVIGAIVSDPAGPSIHVGSRDIPVLAGFGEIAQTVRDVGADTVVVAGQRSGDNKFVRNLSWELETTSAELVLASGLTDVAGPRIHMRPVEGLPLMHVELPNFEGGKHLLKRAFDVVASSIALLLLSPVLALIGLLIRLDSDGPVLFRQERVGKSGRAFTMLKFRSMVQTAEDDLGGLLDQNEGSGVLFKIRNDPRVTSIGRVLRRYSLDELPQLWNIFVGDMSIVGPRPPLPKEVSEYENHVHRRLYVKPGLTGLWQVNGRSDLNWDESVRLDLYYVENWSLTGDLMIIWRTVKVLLNPTGAY